MDMTGEEDGSQYRQESKMHGHLLQDADRIIGDRPATYMKSRSSAPPRLGKPSKGEQTLRSEAPHECFDME